MTPLATPPEKGALQPVAPQQLLWLWVLWVQLWVPLPLESTTEPFGCHNIFRKAVFPLWPIVFFVTCHNSLPPPPPPPPPPLPEWHTN